MTYMYDLGQYCNEKIDANHSKGPRCQSFVVRSIFDWSGRGTFYWLSPTCDIDRISPYAISTIASRQILQTNIIWIVWQTVRRITQEILGVKGLTLKYLYISFPLLDLIIPIWQFGREPDPSIDCSSHVTQLCRELGGVTICRKGQEDIIADGKDGKCRSHKSCVHFSLQFCMYLWKVLFIGSWTSHLQSPLGPSSIWRRTINALSSASVFTHLKKLYIDVKTPLQTPFSSHLLTILSNTNFFWCELHQPSVVF